jgi:hypothetical protein
MGRKVHIQVKRISTTFLCVRKKTWHILQNFLEHHHSRTHVYSLPSYQSISATLESFSNEPVSSFICYSEKKDFVPMAESSKPLTLDVHPINKYWEHSTMCIFIHKIYMLLYYHILHDVKHIPTRCGGSGL